MLGRTSEVAPHEHSPPPHTSARLTRVAALVSAVCLLVAGCSVLGASDDGSDADPVGGPGAG
ncbi:hypothetical protein STAFG_0113 [Streptomyces afghaniensis 772]|uniref:Uncharacterized protein n=1 Tax=Streptomyces afghaniensis 772 TaxID=1283301 RepID=S4MZW1_9ACTN|nr:hypothetical protein STAFG_0113 [Streptomyces afghaniensis 772]